MVGQTLTWLPWLLSKRFLSLCVVRLTKPPHPCKPRGKKSQQQRRAGYCMWVGRVSAARSAHGWVSFFGCVAHLLDSTVVAQSIAGIYACSCRRYTLQCVQWVGVVLGLQQLNCGAAIRLVVCNHWLASVTTRSLSRALQRGVSSPRY